MSNLKELFETLRPEAANHCLSRNTDNLLAEFRSRQDEYFDDDGHALGGIDLSSMSKLTEMLKLVNQMEKEITVLRSQRLG